ncbi:peptidoglycan-binding protein LysM [Chryseobacterium taklimakanense]|nr:peptidoglycan-binding protein LysM [Chryseobacterium taklimakanense]
MKANVIIRVLCIGVVFLSSLMVRAQHSGQVSAVVNIVLADVLSIDLGSGTTDAALNFNYLNTSDYNAAKTVTVPNSLVIISSKNFDLKVKSEGADFVNGTDTIPVDVLQIKAVAGGSLVGTFNEVTLSEADKVLVSNASVGAGQSLNIAYSISAEKASKVLLGKARGTYSQKVIYTATAL